MKSPWGMKMVAVSSLEMAVTIYCLTKLHIPEDLNLHENHFENLQSWQLLCLNVGVKVSVNVFLNRLNQVCILKNRSASGCVTCNSRIKVMVMKSKCRIKLKIPHEIHANISISKQRSLKWNKKLLCDIWGFHGSV